MRDTRTALERMIDESCGIESWCDCGSPIVKGECQGQSHFKAGDHAFVELRSGKVVLVYVTEGGYWSVVGYGWAASAERWGKRNQRWWIEGRSARKATNDEVQMITNFNPKPELDFPCCADRCIPERKEG